MMKKSDTEFSTLAVDTTIVSDEMFGYLDQLLQLWGGIMKGIDEDTYDQGATVTKNGFLPYRLLSSFKINLEESGLTDDGTGEIIDELNDLIKYHSNSQTFTLTIRLMLRVFRAGILPKIAESGAGFLLRQKDLSRRKRATNGMTPQERAERNKRIKESYATTDLKLNSFAINEARKQKLSPSTIKKIIKSQVDT